MEQTELGFQDYWQILRKRWKLILCIVLLSTVAVAGVNYLLPDVFEATVTLMPLEAPSSGLGATVSESFRSMIDISSLAGMGGKSSMEKIINILESRTLCEKVARQLNLQTLFPQDATAQDPWTATVRKLQKMRTIKDNRQGMLIIYVHHTDPRQAAAIANGYVLSLQELLQENAFSLTKKNRLFIEEQLTRYGVKLKEAEERFKEFQTHQKIFSIDEQYKAAIAAIAELNAQVISKTVQVDSMKSFATVNNPEVIQLMDELGELKKQLNIMVMEERQGSRKPNPLPCLQEAPELGVKYLRLKRDIATFEKVYEMLTQQLILAKIQESKEELRFQIIDQAIPPNQKIRPRRILAILITFTAAIFTGILLSILLER